jgi:diguanylate cyclase (GGDEF)-like protein
MAETEANVSLTDSEMQFLQEKKIVTMCVDPDWDPFEVINSKGQHEGISADLIDLVASRTGLNIKLVQTKSWDETLQLSKTKKCDILSFVNQTPERDKWLIFTLPLLSDPNVLVSRNEHSFIGDLHALDGETIAIPAGTSMMERFKKDYPNLKFIPVVSEAEAFDLVSNKKADLTVRSLIVAAYIIRKEGLFNLKISGQPQGYENHLRIGVLKDEPILRDILSKGIETITPIERETIINKHTGLVLKRGIDRETVMKYGYLALLIVFFMVWRYYEIKKYNTKLIKLSITDKLTGLYNRLKIDEKLDEESKRASRYAQYRCGIIMIDVDFFKKINDTYGHQKGDEVLVKLSEFMHANVRATDYVGRWGGEEFIIILPNTSANDTFITAEKLRVGANEKLSIAEMTITISMGVGTIFGTESVDKVLKRVDDALYKSKANGRNMVSITY